jgi:hypothetical protein
MLASEKFFEMHKGRYPGVGINKTEHIIGGRAGKTEEEHVVYEMEGQLVEDEKGRITLEKDGNQEGTMMKRAKMNSKNDDAITQVDHDDEEEDDFDFEEDLNEMIQLAEDLLLNFQIKCAPGTDQLIVDACREM